MRGSACLPERLCHLCIDTPGSESRVRRCSAPGVPLGSLLAGVLHPCAGALPASLESCH